MPRSLIALLVLALMQLDAASARAGADCRLNPVDINPALGASCTEEGQELVVVTNKNRRPDIPQSRNVFCLDRADVTLMDNWTDIMVNADTFKSVSRTLLVFDGHFFPHLKNQDEENAKRLVIRLSENGGGGLSQLIRDNIAHKWWKPIIDNNLFPGLFIFKTDGDPRYNPDKNDTNFILNNLCQIYLVSDIQKNQYVAINRTFPIADKLFHVGVSADFSDDLRVEYSWFMPESDHMEETWEAMGRKAAAYLTAHQVSGCPIAANGIMP